MGIYPNPSMKAMPRLPFSWICMVVNYLVYLKVKVPMSGQIIVIIIYFYLEVLAVLIIVHTCRALSGIIFDTKQDEDKSNFYFF